MGITTMRSLLNTTNQYTLLSRCLFYRQVHKKPRRRWIDEIPVQCYEHDEKDFEKFKRGDLEDEDFTRPQLSVTDKELDVMYDKKIFNSILWKSVIKHRNDTALEEKFKKGLRFRPQIQRDEKMSIAAKHLVDEHDFSNDEYKEFESLLMTGTDQVSVPVEKNVYPFLPADMEKRRERLLQLKNLLSDSEILRDVVGNDTPAIPATFSTSQLDAQTKCDDKSEETEKIVLADPYEKVIGKKTLESMRKFEWKKFYGTPDPNVPISKVACGGCGAFLHCQDSAISGYLPSEIFTELTESELRSVICQRCALLKDYNVALNLSVSPEVYPNIIAKIKEKVSLIILMVDLLDFPCSIWPGIVDLVGPDQPIVVVGNKVDLIPKDGNDYLKRIKVTLRNALKEYGVDRGYNIRKTMLISAKTGHGIEELVTEIMVNWKQSGDIYLVGCTNVGKSTLFNALLTSDLCKVRAMDLIQRATVSSWPGTTLNLLKFPVIRTTDWRIYLRQKRLKSYYHKMRGQYFLRQRQLQLTNNPRFATLIGHVGLTFKTNKLVLGSGIPKDPFALEDGSDSSIGPPKYHKFDPQHLDFAIGKWLYDTPGSIHQDQIISLLTMEELSLTIPKGYNPPRCFVIKSGETLFLAGLGRLDYVIGNPSIHLMVFSSPKLPVSVMKTRFADEYYEKYLGTDVLRVPRGDAERLKDFPKLVPKKFTVTGNGEQMCCADVLLSSAGWISITAAINEQIKVRAYTPDGRGCYLRDPPLLQYAIRMRGGRKLGTPACHLSKVAIDDV